MPRLLGVVLALLAVAIVMRQCRKPMGWIGRFFAWQMNLSHSALTDWGLSHVVIGKAFTILDVGCGGGRTVQKLAAAAGEGRVFGVDYSGTCVAASRRTNAAGIAAGRVEIHEGSVARLPFPDATFDLVTAIETYYYWPDIASNIREILRVLKPGGRLVIVAEVSRSGRFGFLQQWIMKPLGGKVLGADEHRDLLSKAGFSEIDVQDRSTLGWICAIGRRAA